MHKKFMLACMAIAAFAAFVIAPVASASPVLTEPTAGLPADVVSVGASITGVNEGVTTFTASGFNVQCDHDHLSGTVTKNSGTKIEGEIPLGSAKFNGTGTNTDCTSLLGSTAVAVTSKLCLASGTNDAVTITGCGGNVKFDLTITGTETCEYGTASLTGKHSTSPEDAKVTLAAAGPVPLAKGGFPCPSSGTLDMVFDLTTTNGATLTIS